MPSTPQSAALLPVLPMLAPVVGRIGEGVSGNGIAGADGGLPQTTRVMERMPLSLS